MTTQEKIEQKDEVNSLLVGAMRFLNEEQKIALRDAFNRKNSQS